MGKKQQLYYIYKITTEKIEEYNYNLDNYTTEVARKNGELISVGDNQVFNMIRRIRGKETDYLKLRKLYKERETIKNSPSSKSNKELIAVKQNSIDDILLQDDIVNIKVNSKKVYREICKNGFCVNGKRFTRLCCGAGQARRSTVTFVSEDIYDVLHEVLMNGLKLENINIAKYNAYYGLYMSSCLTVTTPRVCVVKDCEIELLNKKVDWVVDKKRTNLNGDEIDTRVIEERIVNFNANLFDGQGLILPRMAKKWSEDLELDYLPSEFIIRSSFIKGMICVFPFDEFAKEVAEKQTLTDCYGKVWNIEDIDVILSTSQFKMWKYYNSWDEYILNCEKYGHIWGVSRITPHEDKEYSLLNYQYLQTLDLNSQDKLEEISSMTIDWIKKICSGDKLYTLLFMLGVSKDSDSLEKIIGKTDNSFVKAIIYNDDLLEDSFIQRKMYKSLERKIREAKIGRLWTRGNYQIMISDPYAMCEHIFGLEVKGLLDEGEHYSNFWNTRDVKRVDGCRSPLVDFSEHNILNLKKNELTEKWFRYLNTGVIFNVWGMDMVIHSDADFDGDILFTTDSKVILDNIYPNRNPITYDKSSAPNQSLTYSNIVKSDLQSFDCKVGTTTNYSTKFISMLCNYEEQSKEHMELTDRIKTLRRYIGDSIDQAKGIKTKPFPSEWKKRYKINEDDEQQLIKDKIFINNLVAKKKPYFFVYIYEQLLEEYNSYKHGVNTQSLEKFGLKLKDLIQKKDKSDEEKRFVSNYYKGMPVTRTSCIINKLAWLIEDMDFEIKFKKNKSNNGNIADILSDKTIEFNQRTFKEVLALYKEFACELRNKNKKNIKKSNEDKGESISNYKEQNDNYYDYVRNEINRVCPNKCELANYVVEICYRKYKNSYKEFVWYIAIDGVLENIKKNKKSDISIPIYDDEKGVEYLGKKYSLAVIES